MRLTVIHMNRLITPTRTPMSTASHQWKRAASINPKATPIGVSTSNMGLAILIQAFGHSRTPAKRRRP
jgi:hypothetical protein